MSISKIFTDSIGKSYEVAAFWQRALAFFIDFLIILAIGSSLDIHFFEKLAPKLLLNNSFKVFIIDKFFTFFILGLPYHLVAEQSSWQGSIGKRILGMIVTDKDADKPSFWQSLLRNFFKFAIIGFVPILVLDAIIEMPFTLALFWLIIAIMAANDEHNRFLSDFPTQSFVLQQKSKRL